MTRTVKFQPFNLRQSVRFRSRLRILIRGVAALAFLIWGYFYLPDGLSLNMQPSDIRGWNVWSLIAICAVITGIFMLMQELLFFFRSIGISGEWHFQLTRDELIWEVPDHAFGVEEGFRSSLNNINRIEHRPIQEHEELDIREFWIHFNDRDSIQLQSHAGYNLMGLAQQICAAGVTFEETTVQK